MDLVSDLATDELDIERPTVLFDDGQHAVYWLGITDETAFRCNTYLLRDGDQALLIDPGNRSFFPQVKSRVAQLMKPDEITGLILCHQDPDVSASMVDWLEFNPKLEVISTPRTHVLLPHYGVSSYRAVNVSDTTIRRLPSGRELRFIEAPFLHFPGAFATYDTTSQMLFSGDVWAALDMNWRLVVEDFDAHMPAMDLFHLDYMASNVASRGFAEKLVDLEIAAILPQHGSIIPRRHVPRALDYLKNLRCGLDIVYADLD
jgi:flavorubredoxin